MFILNISNYIFLGLDFNSMMELGAQLNEQEDIARKCKVMEKNIKKFQDAITSLEKVILLFKYKIYYNGGVFPYFCFIK